MLGFPDSGAMSPGSDTSRQFGSPTSTGSPASSTASMSCFNGMSETRFRLQDKQIEKGKAILMRDYIPTHINIMLYGESGLGKTTCIQNLIGTWDVDKMGEAFNTPGKTSMEMFRRDPDALKIKLKPVRSEEANRDLVISFQDMPGWGDDVNLVKSLRSVVAFLLRQRQSDFHAQEGGFPVNGAANHRGVLQNAITVCLYFLPPHRIKPVDWIMMAAISKLVAVVPVIAKADTFTAQEMEAFRKELLQVIEAATAPVSPWTNARASAAGCASTKPNSKQSSDGSAALGKDAATTAVPGSAAAPANAAAANGKSSSGGSAPAAAPAAAKGAAATPNPKAAPGAAGGVKAVPEPVNPTPGKSSTGGDAASKRLSGSDGAKAAPAAASAGATKDAASRLSGAGGKGATSVVAEADLVGSVRAVSRSVPLTPSMFGDLEVTSCMEVAWDLTLETYTFSADALLAVDATTATLPPFAIVASPDRLPADAPEVMGVCCSHGHTITMPRELWPSPGDPYRRYPWGTAFPLNRAHSDLIILKQLLTGHCNTAIYDLLDDSWKRACVFAEKYRPVLSKKGTDPQSSVVESPLLLEQLVDEVCSHGKTQAMEDRLRDEEQRKLQNELERASSRLKEMEETIKTQKKALTSLAQQLAVSKGNRGLRKLLRG